MWAPQLWGEKFPETPLPIERSAEFGVDLGRNPSVCFSHCPAFKNKKAKTLILEVNGVLRDPCLWGPAPEEPDSLS